MRCDSPLKVSMSQLMTSREVRRREERREVTRYQSFQPLSCLVTTGTIRPATTLCTAQGSLTQGSAEQHYARQNVEPLTITRGSLVSESVDNCLECLMFARCLAVWLWGVSFIQFALVFPHIFILVYIEFVLGPLFCSEFICFPTNMCISGALKLSLQTMPPYQCSGGVISALMCPGLG